MLANSVRALQALSPMHTGATAVTPQPAIETTVNPVSEATLTRLGGAFQRALLTKYGSIFLPPGAKVHLSQLEMYHAAGQRIRGIVVVESPRFTARLDAMAAVHVGGTITADSFPSLRSVRCASSPASVAQAAEYTARLQGAKTEQ